MVVAEEAQEPVTAEEARALEPEEARALEPGEARALEPREARAQGLVVAAKGSCCHTHPAWGSASDHS